MSTFKYYDGTTSTWKYAMTKVTGDTLPIGSQIPYGSTTPPSNWLVCDGSAVSRTTYSSLFAVIGTSYGAGDGSTTFNLPDKRSRKSVGYNANDTDFNAIGKKGGEKTHLLTSSESGLRMHKHEGLNWVGDESGSQDITLNGGSSTGYNISYSGGTTSGQGRCIQTYNVDNYDAINAHNNEDPYETDCWIIKAFQSAGVIAEVSNGYSESATNTYSCNYVNNKTKKRFIKVRANQNQGLTTAGTMTVLFQNVDTNIGDAFQLVNNRVQIIDPTITMVKVTLTMWLELGNNSYAWCHIGTQNASWDNWKEFSTFMQPPSSQVWQTITHVALCPIDATNNFISPTVYFNNASNDNQLRGGTYTNSVYMIVEAMD